MFNTVLPFRYVNNSKIEREGQRVIEHKLTFSCNNHKYIVNVEQYECDLFVVKFYLHSHRLSKNKYKLLTDLNNAGPVIRTCLDILLFFYHKNPYSSFLVVGESGIKESQVETKRFLIYKRIFESLFSSVVFWHYTYPEKSAYMLLNKQQNKAILMRIEDMVANIL